MSQGNSSESQALDTGNSQVSNVFRCRKWVFTLNNYTLDEEDILYKYLNSKSHKWIYGFESGEEGTPHLQGYFEFKNQIKDSTLRDNGFQRAHLTRAKGTLKHNFDYCSKDGNFKYGGIEIDKVKFLQKIDYFYDWEIKIIDLINTKPDTRTIHWFWEPNGCSGKTTFQKYLFTHFRGVAVLSGKGSDMKNGIIEYVKKFEETPDIILINIPRCNIDYISYNGIEEIKDMFFFSGKYEGGWVCSRCPHVIIFANEEPRLDNFSLDRWDINRIGGGAVP